MDIFDAHFHSEPDPCDGGRQPDPINPDQLLSQMGDAGIHGGAIFSPEPESPIKPESGYSYDIRMKSLEKWTKAAPDRLYPVLFIHPLEKDAIDKARDAVSRGVMAFKMICDCWYVYDKPAMDLLSEIAKLGKPVFFHSGILWDGYDSGKFNRPVNWESLIDIPGLRFSLAHCSWPWYDECLAVYGKFLNACASDAERSAEMFLDFTPGTPAIYRRDLFYKVLHIGYDVPHNMMFGTDCTANNYNTAWADEWIRRDRSLMEEFGAGEKMQSLYFGGNLKRFLGLSEKDFEHMIPVPDKGATWSVEYGNSVL